MTTLILVPAPLDFGCEAQAPITDVLPLATLQIASSITHWIAENAKSCRAVIKRIGEHMPLAAPLQQHIITELPREVHKKGDHAGAFDAKPFLQEAIKKAVASGVQSIGLISEAGMPAVADPGSSIVRAAHALSLSVQPLVGPSSLLLALAASGQNGQNFAFVGYLPIDAAERMQRIRALEAVAKKTGQTQLFIEVPHRNTALWQALLASLQPSTYLSFASGLSLPNAQIRSATVADWKHRAAPDAGLPCVMAVGV
ncbi:SAM-dependent methyltransferase [Variovorax sp. PCZ-1]|uniref:SAM-dependent methyltransferase n=1 Tax=Variovorax sp. PCZ-1 TaxID=2835533 RepID=UPI001BD185DD|nr:SAM-dependent methyltransferase [Variovorax sp. PCZ-1]MBS7806630.1 SAM-dependent methyltransferase [Variovorax sp. PCZ-1]